MGIFDFLKNDEPHYDAANIRITDLDVGFLFDYDLSTWEVKEVYEYDWGDDYYTVEFKIDNGTRMAYLSVEEDDELILSVTEKIKIRALSDNLPEHIMDNGKPPVKIVYNGIEYLLDGQAEGYFRRADTKSDSWEEFISWEYFDKGDKHVLCIEQWDDDEFEASVGYVVKEHEITNILPQR